MIGHLRVKSPWSQLLIFIGFVGAALLFSGIVSLLIMQSGGIQVLKPTDMDLNDPHVVNTLKIVLVVSSITAFVLPAIFYAVITFTGKYFYFLGIRKAQRGNMYLLGVACILVAFPFVFWLGELNQGVPLPEWMTGMEKETAKQMKAFLTVNSRLDILVNLFVIAFIPAVCEELCFRGALQRIIINITNNPWVGIIITGILFSAFHFQFQGFLPRMFLGIVLGALYWYSGSLWPSIIAHFFNNAVQVIAVSYAPKYINESPGIPIYLALISGIAVFGILWFYQSQSTVTYSKVYRVDELNEHNQFLA